MEGLSLSTFFYQPTSAPGREGSAPVTTQPVQGPPPSGTEAPPAQAPGLGGWFLPLVMILPFIFIFLSARGQKKKQSELESSIKTGDTVLTQSGLYGKVVNVDERDVRLEIAPGVNVRVLKSALAGVDTSDPKSSGAKDKKA